MNGNVIRNLNQEHPSLIISERKDLISALNVSVEEAYNTSKEKKLLVNIKKNTTTDTIQYDLTPYRYALISEIKRILVADEMKAGKLIRIIYQGKQLKDEDKVVDCKIKEGTFIHIFITEAPKKEKEKEGSMTVITNAELYEPERKGFDKFRPMDIMDEEITLFRMKFHSKFILLADIKDVNEDELYKQEEEFLKTNEEFLLDTESIRQVINRFEDLTEKGTKGNKINLLLGFLLGFVFGVFILIWVIYSNEKKNNFMKGFYSGFYSFFVIIIIYKFYFWHF